MILKMSPSFALIACCLLSGIQTKAFAEDKPEIKEGILRKEVKAQVLERKRTVTVRRILKDFPCTDCHEKLKPFNKPFRGKDPGKMTHENLTFQHMEEIQECTFCHSIINPDRLHLLNGKRITFEQVPDLCGQCHGIRFNEWNMGLHGEESGTWNGPRSSLSCTECHRAHSPRRPKMEAKRAPNFPRLGIPKEGSDSNQDSQSRAALLRTTKTEIKLKERQLPQRHDQCHFCHLKKEKQFEPDKEKTLYEHKRVSVGHGQAKLSCNNCHDINNSNYLRSSESAPASFANSSPVCKRCHAFRFLEWQNGLHGKRIGSWNGLVIQYNCIDCHNPHSVRFKEMEAKKAPDFPRFGIRKDE